MKILAVDDDAMHLKIMSLILRKMGHEIYMAVSGEDAITLSKTFHFDLIFMDARLDMLDGFEATALIRAQEMKHGDKKSMIVGLSAYYDDHIQEKSLKFGMNDFIQKPISLKIIEKFCQKAETSLA